jgi:MFS family permease
MDAFGNWYRRSRDVHALEVPGVNTVVDAAHNVPLDMFAFGGWPLLLTYLVIMGFGAWALIRTALRIKAYDPILAVLSATWFGYQVQSIISINQIGLGVWGWSLSGLIIGYELNTRNEDLVGENRSGRLAKNPTQKISSLAVVLTFLTTSAGIAIALPPYLAANKFYKALQSGDANVIQPAAYLKPYDRARFTFVSQILQENKLEDRAIAVLRDASKIYPDSYEIWNRWAGIASASPNDVARAKAEMKRLDPFNPDLK